MAYINQEMKQVIAANLKPVLAKYKVKGSLSIENYSSLVLTLQSGAIDFKKEYKVNSDSEIMRDIPIRGSNELPEELWHASDDFVGMSSEFLQHARTVLKGANWYDNSNAQIDYFDTAYYIVIRFTAKNGKNYEFKGV